MRIIQGDDFEKGYLKLSQNVQKQTDVKLRLLVANLRHPSLRIKKVRRAQDIYEGSINMHYRFLFQITSTAYILLRVGKHDILEK